MKKNDLVKENITTFDFKGLDLLQKKFDQDSGLLSLVEDPTCEKVHSVFWGWLFNPAENDDLGVYPIAKLFEAAGEHFSALDGRVEVSTEFSVATGRPDIFIKGETFIAIIENKIFSSETNVRGEVQSDRYFSFFETSPEYVGYKKFYFWLCPSSDRQAHNTNFVTVSYQQLYDLVLKPCLEQKGDHFKIIAEYVAFLSDPRLYPGKPLVFSYKPLCEKIYVSNLSEFKAIREVLADSSRDPNSKIYQFYITHRRWLNYILRAVGETPLFEVLTDIELLEGSELVTVLCDSGIIQPEKTILYYPGRFYTNFVKVVKRDGQYFCVGGYAEGTRTDLSSVIWCSQTSTSFSGAVTASVHAYKQKHGVSNIHNYDGVPSSSLKEFGTEKPLSQLKKECSIIL